MSLHFIAFSVIFLRKINRKKKVQTASEFFCKIKLSAKEKIDPFIPELSDCSFLPCDNKFLSDSFDILH